MNKLNGINKLFSRRNALLLAAILTVGTVVGCNQTNPPTTTTSPATTSPAAKSVSLRLPIPVADTGFAPFYLGVDQGFFTKNCLNVTLQPGTPELNPVKMLTQGTDQFSVLGSTELLLTARSKGAPLVAIALLQKDANLFGVITLKKSGITKVSQLEGKSVGFFYGHISTDILRMLFTKENVKVKELDVGFDYSQLITGKIPAQWGSRATAGITLPAKGVEINFINAADYGIRSQAFVVVTTEKMIKEQPQVVQSFVNGFLEATNYSLDNVEASIQATIKRDPNFLPAVGQKQLAIYNPGIKRNTPIGGISEAIMAQTKAQMLPVKLIPADLDIKKAFTTQFVDQYYQKK